MCPRRQISGTPGASSEKFCLNRNLAMTHSVEIMSVPCDEKGHLCVPLNRYAPFQGHPCSKKFSLKWYIFLKHLVRRTGIQVQGRSIKIKHIYKLYSEKILSMQGLSRSEELIFNEVPCTRLRCRGNVLGKCQWREQKDKLASHADTKQPDHFK